MGQFFRGRECRSYFPRLTEAEVAYADLTKGASMTNHKSVWEASVDY